ncbi:MAG: alkyl hydroperoxide reductase/Thiol specific antioxidant/Mal allergen [Haloplasmataceae bacterium]|jgi:peroxiredoxin (alkyl hydroperoxide reductase subunit C)|nr:alkyl hydroperoxide reductase/Thiol specific antioxidant/Mal allergen [Haloplasmataceae bacterium]
MDGKFPLLGEKFPSIEVPTTQGVRKIPEDYIGRWLVLFSHPADFTPVCTTEFVEFALRNDEFINLNTELIGLSVDQVFSHIKWIEWIKEKLKIAIPFPIIGDNLGIVANKLGMVHELKGSNTVRAVFIIDDKGVIRTIFYYPQEVGRNVNEIIRTIKALQTADQNKVAIPANWPYNSMMGDKVILPPPQSIQEAKIRIQNAQGENYTCYDWWLCFKSLS